MGHKINPTGLRLGITQEHRSRWYAPARTYPALLQEDEKIRLFVNKKYASAGISSVHIARKADQLEVELKTARPGVLVGRQGSGIEELRAGIQKTIGDLTRQVRINVVEVERVDADSFLLAEYIAQQLEKRVAFRRVIRMAVQRAQRAGVLGLKIQVSGRLNGAEIARTEWTREGRVPLHTLRADIDYATKVASTTYGVLGIKVWIFKGEMGAGKTTLIKSLAKALQVADSVSSPTFGIVNEYQTQGKVLLYHFDFYRLDDPMEALDIGIEEYFYSGNYCWLEWAENIASFLPERFFLIELTIESETGRLLTLHHHQNGH